MNSLNASLNVLDYRQPNTFCTLWFAVSWLGCWYDFLGRFNQKTFILRTLWFYVKLFAFVKSPGICNGACVCCRTRQSLRLLTTPRSSVYDHFQSNNFLELPVRRSNLLLFVEHVVASPYLRATPSTCVVDIYSFPYLSGGATVLWISVWKVFYRSHSPLEKLSFCHLPVW